MSKPELIAGKWVERRDFGVGINACDHCAFTQSECRTTRHEGRTIRSLCEGIYFLRVKEPEPMEPTPIKPQPQPQPTHVQPTAKQLSDRLYDLSKAEATTAQLRKLMRLRAESTEYRLGLTLTYRVTDDKLVLHHQSSNTTTELETAFLRQAFDVYAEALLTTLLELHTQQVTAMKLALSDHLLETAVEYRK